MLEPEPGLSEHRPGRGKKNDKKVQRSIKGWKLRYFPHQVPLCTTGVHD